MPLGPYLLNKKILYSVHAHQKLKISLKGKDKYFRGSRTQKNKMKHWVCLLLDDSVHKSTHRFF